MDPIAGCGPACPVVWEGRQAQSCRLDPILAARSEFRIQVACQNHRGRAYLCMRCLWRLLVRSANQLLLALQLIQFFAQSSIFLAKLQILRLQLSKPLL